MFVKRRHLLLLLRGALVQGSLQEEHNEYKEKVEYNHKPAGLSMLCLIHLNVCQEETPAAAAEGRSTPAVAPGAGRSPQAGAPDVRVCVCRCS